MQRIMREKLRELEGQNKRFIGKFVKYGSKKSCHYADTILLRDITEYGKSRILANHVWLDCSRNKPLSSYFFQKGDFLVFNADIVKYTKGYNGKRIDLLMSKPLEEDYKFNHVTKIEVINDEERKAI